MSRVLEIPYGQIGDMSKRQPMNLSVLRVADVVGYNTAKLDGSLRHSTSGLHPAKHPMLSHAVKDDAFARWETVALPAGLTLDGVLQRVVKINADAGKGDRVLKIKVRFTDASEITFLRQEPERPDSLRYAGFYSAVAGTLLPTLPQSAIATNPMAQSASTAFQPKATKPRKANASLPALPVEYPAERSQRQALFKEASRSLDFLTAEEFENCVRGLWHYYPHEGVIGVAFRNADSTGSGRLSFREFENALGYLVNYDKVWVAFVKQDGSKRVSQGEFVAGVRRLEPNKPQAELIAAFKKVDATGAGAISFADFCHAIVAARPNVLGYINPQPLDRLAATAHAGEQPASSVTPSLYSRRIPQIELPSAAQRKQLFALLDPRDTGTLSPGALDEAVRTLWPQFALPQVIRQAWQVAGSPDGSLTPVQFDVFARYLVHYNNLWASFHGLDGHEGGRGLSLHEFLAVRHRLSIGSEAAARHAFLRRDKGGAGVLPLAELCEWLAREKATADSKFSQPRTHRTEPSPVAVPTAV
jgi:Ca2+-binding EF-hand superfamily protein